MSYISAFRHADLADAATSRPVRPARIRLPSSRLPRFTALMSSGLEAGLWLTMMSGLSLVLCTIAAGAI